MVRPARWSGIGTVMCSSRCVLTRGTESGPRSGARWADFLPVGLEPHVNEAKPSPLYGNIIIF
jgi:hypothetical protein